MAETTLAGHCFMPAAALELKSASAYFVILWFALVEIANQSFLVK